MQTYARKEKCAGCETTVYFIFSCEGEFRLCECGLMAMRLDPKEIENMSEKIVGSD